MIEAPDYKRQRGLAVQLPDMVYDSAACEGLALAARSQWRELVLALLDPPRK
jgi:2-keto-4-pentenoate hydratase